MERDNPHLHNNVIQIAAERGLLGLGAWLAFITGFLYDRIRAVGKLSGVARFFAINGIACVIAMFIAGLFEYNFGDSEVKMMLMTFMTLAYLPCPGAETSVSGKVSDATDDTEAVL